MAERPTWYEERCLRMGFKQGTEDFRKCIARDLAWEEQNRLRESGEIGP